MSRGRHVRARYGGPLSWVARPVPRRHRRARRLATVLATVACLLGTGLALAVWLSSGGGASGAGATRVNRGHAPGAVVTGRDVAVSWTASTLANGTAVDGYVVRRYSTGNVPQTANASCSGTVAGLSCTELGVPPGTWKYTVEPRKGANWTGAESPFGADVTVGAPAFSITSSTTVATLPTTLSGTIANFRDGEVMTFHLDGPAGPVLSGTVSGTATPAPVPVGGGASVTVTTPAGTTDGLHSVFAVAAPSGENASADIVVSTAAPSVIITFPANGATYDAAGWTAGCSPIGICGTASSLRANSLTAVAVSVRDTTTGLCWTGTGFTSATCPNFLPATGTATWRLALAAAALTDGHAYEVTSRATDDVGHQSIATSTFAFDTSAPVVTLTRVNGSTVVFPFFTNTSIATVGGACSDGDGPVTVTVTGTSSQSGTATCTAGAWTFTMSPTLSAPGAYSLVARQTDSANQTGSSGSKSVVIDTTAPAVTLTRVNGTIVTFPFLTNTSIATVGGACTGGDGPVTVTVAGTSSQSGTAACSAGAWTYGTSPTISAQGIYSITATQADAAGNVGSSGAKTVILVTRPDVAITFPDDGQFYDDTYWNSVKPGCGRNLICGTATAASGTVTAVRVSIQIDPPGGLCWNGSNFRTASCPNFITASGTGSWTLPIDRRELTDGHMYTVTAEATGTGGTTTTTSTFGFDKSDPVVTNVFAVNTATTGIDSVQPGGGIRVYADVTDFSGLSSVTVEGRNVTPLFLGDPISMTPCTSSCTIRGQAYTFVSPLLTATTIGGTAQYRVVAVDATANPQTTTTADRDVAVDDRAPTATEFAVDNVHGGVNGLAEPGDPIDITFSEALSVASLCDNGAFTDLADTDTAPVSTQGVVTLVNGVGAAADSVMVTATDCALHLGTISLGAAVGANYVTGGPGATFSFSGSDIAWNGKNHVLTITLGSSTSSTGGGTLVTDTANTTATYSASSALTDVAGNAATGTRDSRHRRQF